MATEYRYDASVEFPHHRMVGPQLLAAVRGGGGPVLDLGCGSGVLTARLRQELGFDVAGVEFSRSAVETARRDQPGIDFRLHDLGEPLPVDLHARFRVVVSIEVIEHLFRPGALFERATEALRPGGRLVLSTPYHGWIKNVAIAVSGKFDAHVNPLWDYGHIKFFSPNTLRQLAEVHGWRIDQISRLGRVPPLAMTMLAVAVRA